MSLAFTFPGRKCSRCKSDLPPERKHAYCLPCQLEYNRQWKAAHPEAQRRHQRSWRDRNRERHNQMERESDRRRYWSDPETYREIGKRKAAKYGMKQRPLEQRRAHWAVKEAIRSGRLVKPGICQRCGGKGARIEAHHPDHSKPLEIEWLCSRCHGSIRRKEEITA